MTREESLMELKELEKFYETTNEEIQNIINGLSRPMVRIFNSLNSDNRTYGRGIDIPKDVCKLLVKTLKNYYKI